MTDKTTPDATLPLSELVALANRPLAERLAAGNNGRSSNMAAILLSPVARNSDTPVHIAGDRVTVAGAGRQPMRIGRYITALYAGLTPGETTEILVNAGIKYDPTNAAVPEWAVRAVTETLRDAARDYLSNGGSDGRYEIILFDTPDEIEYVYQYEGNFNSCMTDSTAVRCYGYAEDIALAVLYRSEDLVGVDESDIAEDVCPVARVIVNTTRRTWLRTYGSEPQAAILRSHLRRMGYEYDGDTLDGMILPTWEEDGGYAAPYLDGTSQNANLHLSGDGAPYWFICDGGEYEMTSQVGVVSLEEKDNCHRCLDRCHVDEMCMVHWVTSGTLVEGELYCDSCRRAYATLATDPATDEEVYVLDVDVINVDGTDYAKTDALWSIATEYMGSWHLLSDGMEDEADGEWKPFEDMALLSGSTMRYTHRDNVTWQFPLGEELAADLGDPLARIIIEKQAMHDLRFALDRLLLDVALMQDDEEALLAWAAKVRQLLGRIEASTGDCGPWGWVMKMHATDDLHRLHELVFGKPTDSPMGRYRLATPAYRIGFTTLDALEVMANTIMTNARFKRPLAYQVWEKTRSSLWENHRRWDGSMDKEGFERGAMLGWAEIEPSAMHGMRERGFGVDGLLEKHKRDVYRRYENLFRQYGEQHGEAHPEAHRLAELRDILAEEGVHIEDDPAVRNIA